jgi:hypothetical protein
MFRFYCTFTEQRLLPDAVFKVSLFEDILCIEGGECTHVMNESLVFLTSQVADRIFNSGLSRGRDWA